MCQQNGPKWNSLLKSFIYYILRFCLPFYTISDSNGPFSMKLRKITNECPCLSLIIAYFDRKRYNDIPMMLASVVDECAIFSAKIDLIESYKIILNYMGKYAALDIFQRPYYLKWRIMLLTYSLGVRVYRCEGERMLSYAQQFFGHSICEHYETYIIRCSFSRYIQQVYFQRFLQSFLVMKITRKVEFIEKSSVFFLYKK